MLCPTINDGPHLEKTLDDLSRLYPGVASLAVVPVGLTRFREGLPLLRTYTAVEARSIVDYVEWRQREFLDRMGSRFVWPADEFYVLAGREFPRRRAYEDLPQFENGVGMAREFVTVFNRRRAWLKNLKSATRALFLTGCSAYPFLQRHVVPSIRQGLKLRASFLAVRNRFWGDSVTVSGLLTGQDLLAAVLRYGKDFDAVVLPPNCLNQDLLFLDDMSLRDFESRLGKRVVVGRYNLADTIRDVFR